jgi:putative hydrolase
MVPRIDLHTHSEFSPCSHDTSVQKIVATAEARGIEKVAITDHGTTRKPKWLGRYLLEIEKARRETRIDVLTGMEVNIRVDGSLAVGYEILRSLDIIIGAVHMLPIIGAVHTFIRRGSIVDEYVDVLSRALEVSDFHILAHPTNLLWKKHIPPDKADRLIRALKGKGTAIEMNYHHEDPSPEFLKQCVDAGVKITPSSDAHRISDIGHHDWFEQRLVAIDHPVTWIQV